MVVVTGSLDNKDNSSEEYPKLTWEENALDGDFSPKVTINTNQETGRAESKTF